MKEYTFILKWLSGKNETIKGFNILDALYVAGYHMSAYSLIKSYEVR